MALAERLETVQHRLGELRAGTRVGSDAAFSREFMRDHTQFDSFERFCERSPWAADEPADLAGVDRRRLDDYVAETTDFESWAEMNRLAAEEELIDQLAA